MLLDATYGQKRNSLTMLQNIARNDRIAVTECVDKYGNLIWALAKKFTDSKEEASLATQEIFTDIWQYAGRFDADKIEERVFITLIARRHLRKRATTAR